LDSAVDDIEDDYLLFDCPGACLYVTVLSNCRDEAMSNCIVKRMSNSRDE